MNSRAMWFINPGGMPTLSLHDALPISGVVIEGADDVLVKFSKCCNPPPGDDIIGYITRGYGVSIHKRHCTSLAKFGHQTTESFR